MERITNTSYYGWCIVAMSAVGMCFGYVGSFVFGFSSFLLPLSESFGWTYGSISMGMTLSNTAMIIALPTFGFLIDRYGVRRILLSSTVLFGLIFASISRVSNIYSFYAAILALTLLGGGASTVSYVPLISTWFDARKGLALGVGVSGAGIGAIIMPRLIFGIIDRFDWQTAYLALGAANLVIVAPLVYLLVRNHPGDGGSATPSRLDSGNTVANAFVPPIAARYAFSKCLRQVSFWKLLAATFLLGVALAGSLSQLVPLLVARGLPQSEAARVASFLGISIISARLVSGYLIDKFHGPYVAACFLMVTCLGFLALAIFPAEGIPILTTISIGIGLGVEFDVLGYFCAKYFGQYSIGRTYGVMYLVFNVGGALGVYLAGYSYDIFGAYLIALVTASIITFIAILFIASLGAYPQFARPHTAT